MLILILLLSCTGDHDYIVDAIKSAAIHVGEVLSVSEVQVYYKDNGEIASKVDIVLHHSLTIKQAHSIAGECNYVYDRLLFYYFGFGLF